MIVAYLGDVDGDDVGLAALVEEPDGELAGRAAPLLHPHREVLALVLARYPAHAHQHRQILAFQPSLGRPSNYCKDKSCPVLIYGGTFGGDYLPRFSLLITALKGGKKTVLLAHGARLVKKES